MEDNNYKNSDSYNRMKQTENPSYHIKKFHWGACSLCLFWGLGHGLYITLLSLVPILNLIWPIVCGFKGYEWAWEVSKFESMEAFMYSEESWNKAGFILFVLQMIGFVIFIFFAIFSIMALISAAEALNNTVV